MRNNASILRQIQRFVRKLRGNEPAGRNVEVRPDDTFIVSYPRSGNTWTRFLVANLLHPDITVSFGNIESLVPDIYVNTEAQLAEVPKPRVLKSHEPVQPEYPRVIYIVRDPRDVCVSYYYYKMKTRQIPDKYSIYQFAQDFVAGDTDHYGTWENHVKGWIERAGRSADILLLSYEDMLGDPEGTVAELARFFGTDPSPEELKLIVRQSDFERMQELVSQEHEEWVPIQGARKDVEFLRKGRHGSWRVDLPKTAVRLIEEAWLETIESAGYVCEAERLDVRKP